MSKLLRRNVTQLAMLFCGLLVDRELVALGGNLNAGLESSNDLFAAEAQLIDILCIHLLVPLLEFLLTAWAQLIAVLCSNLRLQSLEFDQRIRTGGRRIPRAFETESCSHWGVHRENRRGLQFSVRNVSPTRGKGHQVGHKGSIHAVSLTRGRHRVGHQGSIQLSRYDVNLRRRTNGLHGVNFSLFGSSFLGGTLGYLSFPLSRCSGVRQFGALLGTCWCPSWDGRLARAGSLCMRWSSDGRRFLFLRCQIFTRRSGGGRRRRRARQILCLSRGTPGNRHSRRRPLSFSGRIFTRFRASARRLPRGSGLLRGSGRQRARYQSQRTY